MGNFHYTPSKAERRRDCAWMGYLEQECGYVGMPTFGNALGSAAHRFVAGLHKPGHTWVPRYRHTSARFSPEWVVSEWNTFWADHLRKLPAPTIGYVSKSLLSDFYNRGLNLGPEYIRAYLSTPRIFDIEPDKIEYAFPTTHVPGTSIHLSVRIDQIRHLRERPGEDIIVDLKFSSENNFDPRTNFAMRCYTLVYHLHYHRLPAKVAIWNVPKGREGWSFTTPTEAELEETKNDLGRIGRQIKQRKWDVAGGGKHCDRCQQKEICTNPSVSVELQTLARRNRDYSGPLPKTRYGIIQSRLLELPEDGVPVNMGSQAELALGQPEH